MFERDEYIPLHSYENRIVMILRIHHKTTNGLISEEYHFKR